MLCSSQLWLSMFQQIPHGTVQIDFNVFLFIKIERSTQSKPKKAIQLIAVDHAIKNPRVYGPCYTIFNCSCSLDVRQSCIEMGSKKL